jgi:hypothetical protein
MDNSKTEKICRQCRRLKPMTAYASRRMHVCTACHVQRRNEAVWFHTHKSHPEVVPPSITTTTEGLNFHRRRMRRARKAAEELAKGIEPKRPLYQGDKRMCRRCQTMKRLGEFGSWRYRVCLACDGPTLEDLMTKPPKPR